LFIVTYSFYKRKAGGRLNQSINRSSLITLGSPETCFNVTNI